MVTHNGFTKLPHLPLFPALLKIMIIPYMHSLALNLAYYGCRGGRLRARSKSLLALRFNFVSNLNQLSPFDLFANSNLVDIVSLKVSTRPLLILWEALSELLSQLFLQLLDRLIPFKLHRGDQLLCKQIQILSLVRLKLKKGLDLRFLDVHNLCNLLLFLLSEILYVYG